MIARAGLLKATALACLAAILLCPVNGLSDGPKLTVETLLKTGTTNLGQPLTYPSAGPAEVTALIVTLEPGQETGRHRHAVPLYGQVLSGRLTVEYDERDSKTYAAGEAFMEAVDTWHNGRNDGKETVRVLAIFMGAKGVPNTEHP